MEIKNNLISYNFYDHEEVLLDFKNQNIEKIKEICNILCEKLSSGSTIFWCGNGGSASDSLHLSAELVGRFKNNRKPLRSITLNSDVAVLTCISNDFEYADIFSRQIEGLADQNDVLVGISTSGKSTNIINAFQKWMQAY